MKTIWKFGLKIADHQEVTMPVGAEILAVQWQGDRLFMWAIVDSRAEREQRRFHVFGTGHGLPNGVRAEHHIGTVQQMGGALVWHVFEAVAMEKGGE